MGHFEKLQNRNNLIKGGFPIGTVRLMDGKNYKKIADTGGKGDWQEVVGGEEPKVHLSQNKFDTIAKMVSLDDKEFKARYPTTTSKEGMIKNLAKTYNEGDVKLLEKISKDPSTKYRFIHGRVFEMRDGKAIISSKMAKFFENMGGLKNIPHTIEEEGEVKNNSEKTTNSFKYKILKNKVEVLDNEENVIGGLIFEENDNKLYGNVWVSPFHQRKGIASKLYDLIEEKTGKIFHPVANNSPDAEKFWKKRLEKKPIKDLEKYFFHILSEKPFSQSEKEELLNLFKKYNIDGEVRENDKIVLHTNIYEKSFNSILERVKQIKDKNIVFVQKSPYKLIYDNEK